MSSCPRQSDVPHRTERGAAVAGLCLVLTAACGSVDRCDIQQDTVAIAERDADGVSYASRAKEYVGSHTIQLAWLPQSGLHDTTSGTLELRHRDSIIERELWTPVHPSDASRCPTSLETVELDAHFSTDDGALDEQFVWRWEMNEDYPRVSTHFKEPQGTLRVPGTGSEHDEWSFGLHFIMNDGQIDYFSFGLALSRSGCSSGGDCGGSYRDTDLAERVDPDE